jgi:diamine N-acetyltransferase
MIQNMDYIIRKATKEDIPQLKELNGLFADYHHKLDPYWKSGSETKGPFGEYITEALQQEDTLWLVVESDGKLVGFFSAKRKPGNPVTIALQIGHIADAFLLPDFRGKGIAKEAILKIIDWFKEKGIKFADLNVDSRNVEGIRAWESLGFKDYMKKMRLDL